MLNYKEYKNIQKAYENRLIKAKEFL